MHANKLTGARALYHCLSFKCWCREEVMTLQSLRHPNVLQFLGVCSKPPNLCMVTEHMPFNLHSVLYTSKAQARLFCRLSRMHLTCFYVHSHGVDVISSVLDPQASPSD